MNNMNNKIIGYNNCTRTEDTKIKLNWIESKVSAGHASRKPWSIHFFTEIKMYL